ncbi:MAG: hypothetical protein QXX55_00295 [Candidatus Pacearchaeota archaeon]
MAIVDKENSLGAWAFLIGVILAVLIGLSATIFSLPDIIKYNAQIYGMLVFLGLLIGFVGVPGDDSQKFLLTSAILVIVSRFGMEGVKGSFIGFSIGNAVSAVFGALLALFVPATIIVALKTVFSLAKI